MMRFPRAAGHCRRHLLHLQHTKHMQRLQTYHSQYNYLLCIVYPHVHTFFVAAVPAAGGELTTVEDADSLGRVDFGAFDVTTTHTQHKD